MFANIFLYFMDTNLSFSRFTGKISFFFNFPTKFCYFLNLAFGFSFVLFIPVMFILHISIASHGDDQRNEILHKTYRYTSYTHTHAQMCVCRMHISMFVALLTVYWPEPTSKKNTTLSLSSHTIEKRKNKRSFLLSVVKVFLFCIHNPRNGQRRCKNYPLRVTSNQQITCD